MMTQSTDSNFLNPFLRMLSSEEDILYNILKRLNEETVIALGYTCKRCRQIFEAFNVWER